MRGKYQKSSPTSREAAFFAEDFSGSAREQVFLQIVKSGGATDEEVQSAIRMNPSTQRPRRVELVELGLIKDSKYVRKTSAGLDAVIWIATGKPYSIIEASAWQRATASKKERERLVMKRAVQYKNNPTPSNQIALLVAAKQLP